MAFSSFIGPRPGLWPWRKGVGGSAAGGGDADGQPLRAELFNTDQLKLHARQLAQEHELDPAGGRNHLLPRLAENERVLLHAYDLVMQAVTAGKRVAPAAEWLLDNFHLIEQQIRLARRHLPREYSRQLPRLRRGPFAGYPRVYELASELIAHGDGRVDAENITQFVAAYQTIRWLKLGELWAVPIMLRLALIENVRRVAARLGQRRERRNLATQWAQRLLAVADREPKDVIRLLAELAESNPPLVSPFVEEFCARLQGQHPSLNIVLAWVEQRLTEQGLTIEQLLRADSRVQVADQESIGNSIVSLRLLSALDWREFVETLSGTEQTLRHDPADVYARMDFHTRDRYRHCIEEIAKRSPLTEEQVTAKAVELAAAAGAREGKAARAVHVGFHLIDRGRPTLERAVGLRRSPGQIIGGAARRFPLVCYLSPILLLSAVVAATVVARLFSVGTDNWRCWLLSALALVGASQMAVGLVNLVAALLLRPHTLPRLDFSGGIPPEHRTMVVIPTLLSSREDVGELLEGLEVRYLGNRDENLLFGLLTDFSDATEETQPDDEELLGLARDGIRALNEKYGRANQSGFYLLHRPRVWNPFERIWMGYERKRGKLEQFNALLRGGSHAPFAEIIGDPTILSTIQHVITLDTDTQLPRDAARRLVGTLAHPLNQSRIDAASGRVVDGYAILQPRTTVSLVAAGRSRFARLFAGEAGVDPYTREVSDTYQDAFGEGSYVGKGIYNVDAFHRAAAGRFPANLILSHDLLESCYARSGLVTDIELYEDHPSSYLVEISRRHRWIRGDWQIAGWLLPRVPGPTRQRLPNPLTVLGRWKLFDNLRRSLMPLVLLALLVGGWWLAPEPTGFWTMLVLMLMFLPMFFTVLLELGRKTQELKWRTHLPTAAKALGRQLAVAVLSVMFLPYRAWIHLEAILRSGVRMLFTRRGLLLWHTPYYARRNSRDTLGQFFVEMAAAPLLGAALLAWLALRRPAELAVSGALLVLWLAAPAVAWWISQPLRRPAPALSDEQQRFLHVLARRTWRYFETFVGPQDNWLPPDNFQETPTPTIATRTSPTNIGMSLLATLAARDFGFIGVRQLLERTDHTLSAMNQLERYRGHFYNWYETRTLKPLPPQYISSVDSGNLAGCLFTLRAGLLELKQQPLVSTRTFTGLQDTLRVLASFQSAAAIQSLQKMEATLATLPAHSLRAAARALQELTREAEALCAAVTKDADDNQRGWAETLAQQSREASAALSWLAPWAAFELELPDALGWLDQVPTLEDLAQLPQKPWPANEERLKELRHLVLQASEHAAEQTKTIDNLAQRCGELADMDFSFLYDASRELLSIGYNVHDRRLDPSYYDLLASEARLASFLLVAQGEVPQDHWFALGRQLTSHDGALALLSWSGSMFEYLMPLLIMPTYPDTLLDATYRGVVARQIEYGRERGLPWGISESCYNVTDLQGTYQYQTFGVPGLGFKRGLADDLVIAPYASVLGLMVAPEAACENLERLTAQSFQGAYGFYEAIDYTPTRLPRGKQRVIIRNFMAHHQGMSLLSLAYVLLNQPMQRRFLSDPLFRSAELLLQERLPKAVAPIHPHSGEVSAARKPAREPEALLRVFDTPQTPLPEVHLLSNGRYHVMVTNAGGGYSRWNDLAITRWREDAARDGWGTFCYLRDVETGVFWSTAHQPTLRPTPRYEAIFIQARAEYRRRDEEIDSHTEIAVSPEDDTEIRRVTLTNLSAHRRTLELTSYAEVVLAPPTADLAHPCFSNLFVQTEILGDAQAILCTRRPRSAKDQTLWLFHLLTVQGAGASEASFETDRARFIGRGRTVANPVAFTGQRRLSNSEGSVLDPIVAIRQAIVIDPDTSGNVHFITGVAATREAALALIAKYRDPRLAERAFEMAWSHSQVLLRQLDATEAEAQLYGRLASSVIHGQAVHRAAPSVIARNRRGQPGLWASGISGDLPIVLLRIADVNRVGLVKQVLQAHAYWRAKGLTVDLVILNEDFSGYRQALHERILGLIAAGTEANQVDKPGGIFVRRGEQFSEEDRVLLQTVARVVLTDSAETLAEQVERRVPVERLPRRFEPSRGGGEPQSAGAPGLGRDLDFFNGLGGFTRDGREYIIRLGPGQTTPAPWCNVLANAQIGTVISESGGAYTWAENAHEFRLTPWYNDPLTDASGEAFYLRDEESGRFWSPTPLPARGTGTYLCRHGFGYSVFETTEDGIHSELTTYVATDAPVKFMVIKLRNQSGRGRRLSVTGFWELVLGQWREANFMHVVTEIDPITGALFATNAYNREFAGRVAFASVNSALRTVTGSRAEFLGRNGTFANPAALRRAQLSGKVGAALDPCAAVQALVELPDGQERQLVFVLGAGRNADDARHLLQRFGGSAGAHQALEAVWEFWKRTLGTVHVETPDPALNALANGWLLYQALAGRYWGRSGYYQSGGAYGFRDQLQDTLALLHAAPWLTREHLVRCAAHQFREGDVQHWWHPPGGRGVRTHVADDYLWLPYVTCRYVTTTGDTGVLDERTNFLDGRALNADEESYYDLPQRSEESGTLYEHCVRAIRHGLRFGEHGLPLMGSGDWNDGLNLVGAQGKGESVWMGFFLYDVLAKFAALAQRKNDVAVAQLCTDQAAQLRRNLEQNGWDGAWYRRAYFDDGTPLGSATNTECQIDSIAQSWAVLSGAGDPERARQAMQAVDQRLVRRDQRLIQLFDPPFDKSTPNPGYIKGYVPGVRENGGQYTHAAVWTAMAFAELGDHERAWELMSMLNPIHHGSTANEIGVYKVEPYVVAADIYAVPPHTGRGGWTWYTGSASWMYQLLTETLLGLRLEVDKLRITPRLPSAWGGYKIHYRYRETVYHITVSRSDGAPPAPAPPLSLRVRVDGAEQADGLIHLVDDRQEHQVEVQCHRSQS